MIQSSAMALPKASELVNNITRNDTDDDDDATGSGFSTVAALILSCFIVFSFVLAVAFVICKKYRKKEEVVQTGMSEGVVHAAGDTFYLMENLTASNTPLVTFPINNNKSTSCKRETSETIKKFTSQDDASWHKPLLEVSRESHDGTVYDDPDLHTVNHDSFTGVINAGVTDNVDNASSKIAHKNGGD